MALYSSSARANANGEATATVQQNKSGLQWLVYQIAVETIPQRSSAQATVTLNGRYITSTVVGSGSSAQGPPYLTISGMDQLVVSWVGLTAGDSAILTLLYQETEWGVLPAGDFV